MADLGRHLNAIYTTHISMSSLCFIPLILSQYSQLPERGCLACEFLFRSPIRNVLINIKTKVGAYTLLIHCMAIRENNYTICAGSLMQSEKRNVSLFLTETIYIASNRKPRVQYYSYDVTVVIEINQIKSAT